MPNDPKKWQDDDGEVDVRRERKIQKARRYRVVFHNDHYTTKWFVVDVLMRFFSMSETSAQSFMLAVHKTGSGVAGVYTKDIAETKVAQVMDYAREYEMPLKLTAEPED